MDAETRRRAEDSNVEKVTGRTAGNGLPKGRPFFCTGLIQYTAWHE